MVGGGSGGGRASYVVPLLDAIKAKARRIGARAVYLMDHETISNGLFESIYPSLDICLVFLKTYSREAVDRGSYVADWTSTIVVEEVSARCPGKTLVITHSAGLNTMPWATNSNITGIFTAHLPGEETGNSIVEILCGHVNPSGRLPYTIAQNESDYNAPIVNLTGPQATESTAWQSDFVEGLMMDYRHFDNSNITPLYEFGFGLSYTTFDLSGKLVVSGPQGMLSKRPTPLTGMAPPGGNSDLWKVVANVSTTVQNIGELASAIVVQLYLSLPSDSVPSGTPVRVLRGFEKVHRQAGLGRRRQSHSI
ncbi:beta-glucosidase [Penicillium angulare]|uniref:beta-glucosidase n=1 Tax=Penicillium angulare TaxID=116970 RepID=UPI00254249F9|nr:beta-glucosidase [Penicillium angulare]KAJ5256985.1 beta-glucosidase [Penicillium angulare]